MEKEALKKLHLASNTNINLFIGELLDKCLEFFSSHPHGSL
jgi:hypothetical protein